MKIKGTVKFISEVVSGISASGKEWKKQSVVIEEDAQYPNSAVIDWFNKEINFVVGDEIEVDFNIKATAPKDKYFNNLSAWTWTAVGGHSQVPHSQIPQSQPSYNVADLKKEQSPSNNYSAERDENDELPF